LIAAVCALDDSVSSGVSFERASDAIGLRTAQSAAETDGTPADDAIDDATDDAAELAALLAELARLDAAEETALDALDEAELLQPTAARPASASTRTRPCRDVR
jgi:hypothetical protein